MAVYLVAAALVCFYLTQVPLSLALWSEAGALKVGARVFGGLTLWQSEARTLLRKPRKPLPPIVKPILKRLWPAAVRLDLVLALGDAAQTALACGAVVALCRAAGPTVRARVRPDFAAAHWRAEGEGIATWKIGHIMRAALVGAAEYGAKRGKKWNIIQSRAS